LYLSLAFKKINLLKNTIVMSNHHKIWGSERFLMGLALFLIIFMMLWAYVYFMNDDFLPKAK